VSICKREKLGPGVMAQDKPAPRKAPLIILLFWNGALCLQNTGQSISYSETGGVAGKKGRSIRSAGKDSLFLSSTPPLLE